MSSYLWDTTLAEGLEDFRDDLEPQDGTHGAVAQEGALGQTGDEGGGHPSAPPARGPRARRGSVTRPDRGRGPRCPRRGRTAGRRARATGRAPPPRRGARPPPPAAAPPPGPPPRG